MSGTQEWVTQSKSVIKVLVSTLGTHRARPARQNRRASLCRASLRDRTDDQVPTEQVNEAEWTTKTLPSKTARRSKSARQSERPSPCRASLQDGVNTYRASLRDEVGDQVPTEQVREAEQTTKSLLSMSMRRNGRPGPRRSRPKS